jgi:hypothetical protein
MTDLFDQPTLHRGSTDTSQAAADAMDAGGVGSLRRAVYDAIRYAGTLGLTTREASDVVCWKYEGVQPRTSELRDNGYIRDSDDECIPLLNRFHLKGHDTGEITNLRKLLPDEVLTSAFNLLEGAYGGDWTRETAPDDVLREALRLYAKELYKSWKSKN